MEAERMQMTKVRARLAGWYGGRRGGGWKWGPACEREKHKASTCSSDTSMRLVQLTQCLDLLIMYIRISISISDFSKNHFTVGSLRGKNRCALLSIMQLKNKFLYLWLWLWVWYILVPKGAQMGGGGGGGVGFLTVNKICFKHFVLLLCVCIHNWSVSQWKQYELQIWSSWRNIIFWKWKAPWNSTPENGHAHGECFWCFHSCTWWIKTLPQSPICTEEISLYTVHIKSIITTTTKLELEALKCPSIECYVCWNVSWPASTDNLVKNWLSLSSKLYSSHCGTLLHQAPLFYFTAKHLGSF